MRSSQPQGPALIDWSNPITKGLVFADASPGPSSFAFGSGARSVIGAPGNTVGKVGKGVLLSESTNAISYGKSGITGSNITVLAVYQLTAAPSGPSRLFGNFSANNYGYAFSPNSTNYRFVLGFSGASYVLTGSSIVANKIKIDVGVSTSTVNSYWENGVRTVSPVSNPNWVPPTTTSLKIGADNGGVNASPCKVFAVAVWNRVLSDAEIKSLSGNPWQIFAENKPLIFVGVSASVSLPTLVQPESDTTPGAWTSSTGGTLASCISETVPEDTDFISVSSASTCEMVLAESAFPGTGTQILKYRASSTSASSLTVTLKQGATVIMTRTHVLTGTVTEYTDTLTSGEIATIVSGPISVTLECS